ncbi:MULTISPECIES: LytR C-terminal domain-containing protein [unclassified Pseudarthrobacter]|uniref:LytR C-terminal domain-containing protein n=1 Tax=unclassified Pseudarthrobacter TaxID=2647000 RepID=UPI001131E346|nr:LytR C-terminal domain-containing protein [Pseudarthrobacter sp. NIBRBAC000502772]QDG65908.1 LytR family transcriptional regulator [Pseudarthrobacter sp. NIBRBAC000502772]
MTKYARDEFDKVPESASRQGVHRAASAPARRKLWPILAVGIVALAIGVVSFLILPKLGFTQAGSDASTSLESAAAPEASAAPSATAEASTDPKPSNSPDAEPSASPSNIPSAVVLDKTQGVAIYNAAGKAGLAGRISSMVQADGWTLGQVGNWGGAPQQTSAIFYSGPAQKANAEALSELLNIPTLVESQDFQVPLVVVLGPGYQ